MSGAGRTLNQLSGLLLILSLMLVLVYAIIFINPQFLLNPFKPPSIADQSVTPTPTITLTPSPSRPPSWTPTYTPGPTDTPSPTRTSTATATPDASRTAIPSRTSTPTPTPPTTPTPPGPTFSAFKYTKTNDPITFRADPYGAVCGAWLGVAGQVLDRDGTPLPGVSVVGWGGPIPEQNKRVFVSGSSIRINDNYGSAGAYEIFIGAPGEFDFNIQVYENGQPVSDVIQLHTSSDCRADLAIVNLQRNH